MTYYNNFPLIRWRGGEEPYLGWLYERVRSLTTAVLRLLAVMGASARTRMVRATRMASGGVRPCCPGGRGELRPSTARRAGWPRRLRSGLGREIGRVGVRGRVEGDGRAACR